MQRLKLRSITVKKYRPQKSNTPVPEGKPNLLKQDFNADLPNQKWVTDITYIYTVKDDWTYLASVLDLCLHKVIGYTYDRHMTAEMATQALKNATLNVKDTADIIIHSDLGSQYTSQEFEDYVTQKKMLHFFNRKGNPYDNAMYGIFSRSTKKRGSLH